MTDEKSTQPPKLAPKMGAPRKAEEDKAKHEVKVYFTAHEHELVKARALTFSRSKGRVVRYAAMGVDPIIPIDVPPDGGIERVMSLADQRDYRLFKRNASNFNSTSRKLNKLAKAIEALEQPGARLDVRLSQLLELAESLEEEAIECNELARVLVQAVTKGPR